MRASAPVRVLIADDSATLREALATLLALEPGIQVVGQARDGQEALALCRTLRPDVVTMDVQMPGLDGLAATEAIMEEAPARVLMVCSVAEEAQLDLSFRAVEAGALELIAKPGPGEAMLRAWARRVADAVRLMAEVPVVRRVRTRGAGGAAQWRPGRGGGLGALGIVASAGGPPALARIVGELPADLPVPLLLAQHIAPGFTDGLRRWLEGATRLPVRVAQDGAPLAGPGVWLAPDGCDLTVQAGGVLRTAASVGIHSPSGDRLLSSLAANLGARAAGLVLTGMGDDGAQGLLALRRAGGRTFAQDEATSAVYGMPHAAHALGAVQELVALDRIAPLILELA